MNNQLLNHARVVKKDEFYTQYDTIEKEMKYHFDAFRNKTIMCNCDDPVKSNFSKYFLKNFNQLHLKRLIVTGMALEPAQRGMLLDISRVPKQLSQDFFQRNVKQLGGNGDYASKEVINYMKQADIVVTNPPFSKFRPYLATLIKHNKKFLIIGNVNAITSKEVFPLIKNNQIWLGASIHSGDREFRVPDDYPLKATGSRIDKNGVKYIRVKGVRWFTNLDYKQRHEDLILYKHYLPNEYPKYDNYNGINVDKTADIPMDFNGAMGVPITFLDKYSPEQFKLIKFRKGDDNKDLRYTIDGETKQPYFRIIIKNKKVQEYLLK